MKRNPEFRIRDVGGIRDLVVRLLPGVNVLRGRNGAGKSTAIAAVTRASGGDAEIEARDGAPIGTVEGPGVTLRVRKVVRTGSGGEGTAQIELADTGPLTRLIDPGIADPDRRAAARLRAFSELANLPVDEGAIQVLADLDNEIGQIVCERQPSDLIEAADLVRRTAHEIRRRHEEAAAKARLDLQVAAERAGLVEQDLAPLGGEIAEDPDELGVRLANTEHRIHRLEDQAAVRRQLEQQQDEIRQSLGERPDVELARTVVADLQAQVRAAENRLREQQSDLAIAQRDFDAIQLAAPMVLALYKQVPPPSWACVLTLCDNPSHSLIS